MPGTSTSVIIHAPPKAVYDVVLDFEKYPEFLPDVKHARVEKRGKSVVATFEISVIKRVRYTLSFSVIPAKKIHWTFVKSDLFKDNRGSWEFEEVKKGETRATYTVDVDFRFPVPSLITKALVGSNLPTMMRRFKDRVEGLG